MGYYKMGFPILIQSLKFQSVILLTGAPCSKTASLDEMYI